MTARSARPDVPLDQTWRLDDLFTSVEEWEAERAAIEQMIPEVSEFQGRLGEGPQVLLECSEALESLMM